MDQKQQSCPPWAEFTSELVRDRLERVTLYTLFSPDVRDIKGTRLAIDKYEQSKLTVLVVILEFYKGFPCAVQFTSDDIADICTVLDQADIIQVFNAEVLYGVLKFLIPHEQRMIYWRFRTRDIFGFIKFRTHKQVWPSLFDLVKQNLTDTALPFLHTDKILKEMTSANDARVDAAWSQIGIAANTLRALHYSMDQAQLVKFTRKATKKNPVARTDQLTLSWLIANETIVAV